ncbi:hypothetical protein HD842_004023 [Massilia aurea]|uniref:Peptidase M4 n=1 Tax=Massilia aurea TaxID=373040 RepID=A0A7W9X3N5_9BURK|nr:hypothetical protein [Massilia aurea]MBB6135846.1 hypothetical protein [Massilia aurea]
MTKYNAETAPIHYATRSAGNPPFRRLRAFALDPSLSLRLETAPVNHTVMEVPWEANLQPGPRGEYVEVLDYDPASGCWYEPVDLNATVLLAQDGVAPSQGNPQFHQQMVYAVAMKTIASFEQALGRRVQWSPRDLGSEAPIGQRERYVSTLRIYPHALRAANAYYSPEKKALLFGYFQGPAGTVFSCLSQDIVAHETTHALLDGMHRRYVEDNHLDTLAFHEAFADLVALFQHFTLADVLRHQLERTRGDLETAALLGELAQEFGEATGRYGALRSAIGNYDAEGVWQPVIPDTRRLNEATQPHERGAILVSAIFSSFLAIYKLRSKHIFALASSGSGVLPEGALPGDVIGALAKAATKTARHFLNMCIRALDYCPPFDITFGDYLRALVTADYDMMSSDRYGYRVALIESFRRWGIVPEGLKVLSEEQLRWGYAEEEYPAGGEALGRAAHTLKGLLANALFQRRRDKIFETLRNAHVVVHRLLEKLLGSNTSPEERKAFTRITGLNLDVDAPLPGIRDERNGQAIFEVHAVLPALRVTPDGRISKQLIITVTQQLREVPIYPNQSDSSTFTFRGGCTLIFDMTDESPRLSYAITRPIDDQIRLEAVRRYKQTRMEHSMPLRNTYFGGVHVTERAEPFCMLHDEH